MLLTAGRLDISPAEPLPLSGWSHRTSDFKTVKLGLEANILILDQNNTLYVIISLDCLFISSELKSVIKNKLNEHNLSYTAYNILLLASHTHFAPCLDKSKPELGKADRSYIEHTFNKIADTCKDLIQKGFINGKLQYFKGKYSKVINRRRKVCLYRKNIFKWKQKVVIGPNILGPKNDTIHLIKLFDDHMNCICVFWSFACHPVDEPEITSLSSEYIGVVRKHIRKSLNTNIPVIFAQGFAGNIRAGIGSELNSLPSRLKTFLKLPDEFKSEPENHNEWCLGLLNAIDKTLLSDEVNLQDKPIGNSVVSMSLKELIYDYKGPINDLKLQKWQLGGVLLVCLSAEPVTEYNNILNSHIKDKFIPIGYTADSFGYLPVSSQIKEGGYESEGFFKFFSIEGKFKDKPEEKVIAFFDQLNS